ncbi:hypothetical protein ABZ128_07860 [Streptomyces sp. NPDC006326]|uniref:hypothetical protein n=1 Tax=Streptomyces sp. NPDC006326 TaxID=3156752 RepID=UPI0033B3D634
MEIPTAEVGEPTGGLVKVTNDQGEDLAVSRVSASSDSGRMEVSDDTCTGASLPPGGSCEVTVRHVAAEPGPYTGALAVSTSLGTLSAPLSGEAVGAQPPAPTGMETSTPEGTPTETGSAEPPSDGTDTTQSPPVDEPAYAPPRPR